MLVNAGGVDTWCAVDGDGPPILMLNRMGVQATDWNERLVALLLAGGVQLIRYDYRDIGGTVLADDAADYTMVDLARDAIALLDGLGLESAHLFGTSVGGVFAQIAAADHPDRVRSLVLLNSSSGDRSLPMWTPRFEAVGKDWPGAGRQGRIDYLVREIEAMQDDRFDEASARERAERMLERGWEEGPVRRNGRSTKAGRPDLDTLRRIEAPTLVVHGTIDSVLPVEHGRSLAEVLADARLVEIDGMCHDVQDHYAEAIAEAALAHVRAVERRRSVRA